MKKYDSLEHTADIKFRCYGKTVAEVFENAALAISNYLAKENKIKSIITKKIEIESNDMKSLLYLFIDEIIFLLDAKYFITKSAKVKINDKKLTAFLKGDSTKNYKGLDHIKAATYSEMEIKKVKIGYEGVFVIDV